MQMAEMLDEYFRIGIGNFESTDVSVPTLRCMPELLAGHSVQPFALPEFLIDLTTRVNWEEEEPCFRDVALCLGKAYAKLPPVEQPDEWDENGVGIAPGDERKAYYIIKHLLFPAFRVCMVPQNQHGEPGATACVMIASLENLYKIFERC